MNRLIRRLYAWLCERLYHELAGIYDAISWLVSLGHWDEWRSLALTQLDETSRVSDVDSLSEMPGRGRRCADIEVLELGCGTGILLQHLAARGNGHSGVVVGLDRSPAMIAVAARRLATMTATLPDGDGRIRLIRGAAEMLPLAAHSVGAVVSTFPAPYILERETLRECWRVLYKPTAPHRAPMGNGAKGRWVIVGLWVRPVGNSFSARLMRLLPVFYGAPSPAVQQEMTRRIESAGFRVKLREVSARNAWVGMAVAYPIAANADNVTITAHPSS